MLSVKCILPIHINDWDVSNTFIISLLYCDRNTMWLSCCKNKFPRSIYASHWNNTITHVMFLHLSVEDLLVRELDHPKKREARSFPTQFWKELLKMTVLGKNMANCKWLNVQSILDQRWERWGGPSMSSGILESSFGLVSCVRFWLVLWTQIELFHCSVSNHQIFLQLDAGFINVY